MTDENMLKLSVGEVARLLNISDRAVIYKIQDGELKGEKSGRSWVIYYPKEGVSRRPATDVGRKRVFGTSEGRAETSEKPTPNYRQFRKEDKPAERKFESNYVPKSRDDSASTGDDKPKREYKKKFEDDFRKSRVYMQMEQVAALIQEHDFLRPFMQVLSHSMEKIAVGYTIFGDDRKIQYYNEARDWLAVLIHRIHMVDGDENAKEEVITSIRKDTIGLVVSLIRSAENRKKDRPRR